MKVAATASDLITDRDLQLEMQDGDVLEVHQEQIGG